MEKISDEVFKQICVNSTEQQIKFLGMMNKRFSNLFKNKYFIETVYHQKCEKEFAQKIMDLKELDMKWEEFYKHVSNFNKHHLTIDDYCINGKLVEIQLFANMDPPVYVDKFDVLTIIMCGHLKLLKYVLSLNILDLTDYYSSAGYTAAIHGRLDILKYLVETFKIQIKNAPSAARHAAIHGNLDMLKYFVETLKIKAPNDDVTAREACIRGHFKIVKYLASLNID